MSLTAATTLLGLMLLAFGGLLLWNGKPVAALLRAFPRSQRAAYVTMGLGAVWTLYRVMHLSEADFGQYRWFIFAIFAALALLSFRYLPDFLSIRGACILCLLVADLLLQAAFMRYEHPGRLFMVAFVYLAIGLALYLAVSPFRVRDFFGWLFANAQRPRAFGSGLAAYGALLLIVASTF
jgi:hypothetical protein